MVTGPRARTWDCLGIGTNVRCPERNQSGIIECSEILKSYKLHINSSDLVIYLKKKESHKTRRFYSVFSHGTTLVTDPRRFAHRQHASNVRTIASVKPWEYLEIIVSRNENNKPQKWSPYRTKAVAIVYSTIVLVTRTS